MEVPIQLQQITSSTLMSSAVAYLCHFKGSMEVFHWDKLIRFYFRPYIYTLDQGVGNLTDARHAILDNRSKEKPCDLQLTANRCLHHPSNTMNSTP